MPTPPPNYDCTQTNVSYALRMTAAAATLLLASCILITDGGTRLAYEVVDGAERLRKSDLERLEVVHEPLSVLSGVKGPYEVVFQQTVDCERCGSLWVGGLGSEGGGGTTSYHRRFVVVPKTLRIEKLKGQPTVIVLRKVSDDIQVEGLR